MTRFFDRLIVVAYLLIAALPVIAMVGGIQGVPMHGVIAEVERPRFTFFKFRMDRYQPAFTAWFERYLGLRSVSVYTDNTLLYHAFGETKPGLGAKVGLDGTLFSTDDLDYYSSMDMPTPATVAAFADKVARVQATLRAQGRALVPVFIPSKTLLYRAEVPPRWTRDLGEPRPSDTGMYLAFKQAFDARRIQYVDAREMLATSKEPRDVLWGVEARHWSLRAACLTMRAIVEQYTAITAKAPIEYPCVTVRQRELVNHDDFDLFRLLNAWGVEIADHTVPIIVGLAPQAALPRAREKLLLVGTSFSWMLTFDAYRSGLFGRPHTYFYNHDHVSWPSWDSTPVEPQSPAWRELTLGRDLIVLDLFETYLRPADYAAKFIDEMDVALHGAAAAPSP